MLGQISGQTGASPVRGQIPGQGEGLHQYYGNFKAREEVSPGLGQIPGQGEGLRQC